ncbi:MAG: hypothetical protein H6738_23055 [Alphaproteobacteria bacterium]|nr:hypothetical protein [Alphaproteobacteria bacterium]MCB9699683.1 hypothetical protein [Alphaproteobacteria bacterium]
MLTWLSLAIAAPNVPCVTMDLLPSAPPVRKGPLLAAGGAKSNRDVWGVPNQRQSKNFVIRWGDSRSVSSSAVDGLLDAFELAWSVQLDDMGHAHPYGTDAFRFNVYIGDTGGGTPPGYGSGGYYWVDDDGWPMVVVSAATLSDPVYSEHTAIHEFYHATQGATDRYAYDGISAWYWEATAEWAALQTQPDNASNGTFVYGYVLLPALPVNFFDYPDTGALQEYHQYGAFLFPYDLTDQEGWELVRDSWNDRGTEPDPMEVLRTDLADRGEDLDEMWLDHVAHLATMDVPDGDLFQDHIDTFGGLWDEKTVSDSVEGAGGEGEARGKSAPGRYGAVIVRLRQPDAGTLTATVSGDPEGTEGHVGRYGARVVHVKSGGKTTYTPLTFVDAEGTAEVEGIEEGDDVFLAIGAWSRGSEAWDTEKFPLSWSMTVAEPEVKLPGKKVPTDPEVWTCASAPSPAGALVGWLVAPLVLARRRRAA